MKDSEEVKSCSWKVEMEEKQEMEEPGQGKLGYTGNASLACVGDRVRVEEQKLVKDKRIGGLQDSGMWRQELGLEAGGERFREKGVLKSQGRGCTKAG